MAKRLHAATHRRALLRAAARLRVAPRSAARHHSLAPLRDAPCGATPGLAGAHRVAPRGMSGEARSLRGPGGLAGILSARCTVRPVRTRFLTLGATVWRAVANRRYKSSLNAKRCPFAACSMADPPPRGRHPLKLRPCTPDPQCRPCPSPPEPVLPPPRSRSQCRSCSTFAWVASGMGWRAAP